MPTAAALSSTISLCKGKGKAKASASATPAQPKVVKRRDSNGRRPGTKAWLIAEFLHLFCIISNHCPTQGVDWIPIAKEDSSQQDTERSAKACQGKWDLILYFYLLDRSLRKSILEKLPRRLDLAPLPVMARFRPDPTDRLR
ncbi:hypothetical protein FRC11_013435, partial [Ceratobasidium sp. 423]